MDRFTLTVVLASLGAGCTALVDGTIEEAPRDEDDGGGGSGGSGAPGYGGTPSGGAGTTMATGSAATISSGSTTSTSSGSRPECTMDDECSAWRYCSDTGACELLKTSGSACTRDGQCISGRCDGTCKYFDDDD